MNSSTMSAGPPTSSLASSASRGINVRLVAILGTLGTFAPLSIDMYLPALPAIAQEFDATAAQVQLTLSACLLGLALGQVIAGPLSDSLGRRRPLIVGIAVYAVASLLCVVAPSIGVLIALRFVQGLAGAAGVVLVSAIVRDLYSGVAAARFFSLLMLVGGLAPILAPLLGGQVMRVASWRGIFTTLTIIGTLILLAVVIGLRESLPLAKRQRGGLGATVATFHVLLTDREFVGYSLASALALGAMFAYSAGSPFVVQVLYGVSPQTFSVLLSINALGFLIAGQVNGWLVTRIAPHRLMVFGLIVTTLGGLALVTVIASSVGLAGILAAMFLVVVGQGFIMPNTNMLALSEYPHAAGSAAALLGVVRFAMGAVAAPLVGLGGQAAMPMALVIASFATGALAIGLLLERSARRQEAIERGVAAARPAPAAGAGATLRALTLSREYGSGGGEIAARLAQRLGWELIDHEVVVRVAHELQIPEADVAAYDERVQSLSARILDNIRLTQPSAPVATEVAVSLNSRAFHEARRKVIDGALATGHVVIVGRGAQAHLAARPDVFHVRIIAPLETRIAYVMRREGRDQAAARARILQKDDERRQYLQTYYQRDPGNPHLYDLVVNTGILDLDSAVDVIQLALERKGQRLASPTPPLGPLEGLAPYPDQPEDFRPPRPRT